MKSILYITFIGARAFYERKNRSIKDGIALAVIESGVVIDCDQKAWSDGVRPGDTLRRPGSPRRGARLSGCTTNTPLRP
jgi:hypothetical protein